MSVTGITHNEKIPFGLLSLLFIAATATAVNTGLYFLAVIPFAALFFTAGWQWRNIIFYLLLFTIPFSFEYQFSSQLGTDVPDELLMLFVSFLFMASWLYSPKQLPLSTIKHPLVMVLLLSLAWALVTVLFSGDRTVSLKYLLAKSWYAGAFVLAPLILFKEKKNIIVASKVLGSSLFLVTMIIQFRHGLNGFSFASINDAVHPFFRNHVNYSAMLVCLLPVLFAFFHLAGNRNMKRWIAAAMMITLGGLFFSYARGAWLALLIGVFAWWFIKKKWLFSVFLAAVITIIAALFWVKSGDRYLRYAHDFRTTIFHKDFGEHLVATYKLKDVSTAERFYRWIAGIRMIKDNWMTGYGPNTFYDNYKGYTVPAYKTWVSDNEDRSTVHNYFLLTAIEQGIPGLMILLVLFGLMLYYSQYLYHRLKDRIYRMAVMATGIILSMILTLNFLSDLVETDKIGSLFFLCLAVLVSVDMNTRERNSDPSPDIQRIP
jgi:O-antigen ligase